VRLFQLQKTLKKYITLKNERKTIWVISTDVISQYFGLFLFLIYECFYGPKSSYYYFFFSFIVFMYTLFGQPSSPLPATPPPPVYSLLKQNKTKQKTETAFGNPRSE
jgi:hypothetical protein